MTDETEGSAWPAVAYEELPWSRRSEPGTTSRNQLRRHQGPYRAAIPAYVAKASVALSAETLATSTDAANEVARFDAEVGGEIAPFSAVLLRSESAASSQIENLTASARAISEAELGERAGPNAQQVLGNVAAMTAAMALSNDLTARSVLDMHDALLKHADPGIAGKWRAEQVWVGGSHLGPHGAAYVAPHHARVPALIEDLIAFIDRDDIPVLVHAALAHAQFETIHPFPDGNGRTGRALMQGMLRGKGLTRNVTVPISAGLLVDIEEYFAALTSYRGGDAEPIVLKVADASYAAVSNGRTLVRDLGDIRANWEDRIHARRGASSWRVADLLLRHPVINVGVVSHELAIRPQHVYRAVAPLIDAGVLVSSGRERDRVWRAQEVLDAVDAFAARAGRRRRSGD